MDSNTQSFSEEEEVPINDDLQIITLTEHHYQSNFQKDIKLQLININHKLELLNENINMQSVTEYKYISYIFKDICEEIDYNIKIYKVNWYKNLEINKLLKTIYNNTQKSFHKISEFYKLNNIKNGLIADIITTLDDLDITVKSYTRQIVKISSFGLTHRFQCPDVNNEFNEICKKIEHTSSYIDVDLMSDPIINRYIENINKNINIIDHAFKQNY
jgi:hypothetical protein